MLRQACGLARLARAAVLVALTLGALFAAGVIVQSADATGAGALQRSLTPPTGLQLGSFKGHGSRVLTVRVPRVGPVVVTAIHRGSANFIVRLVGHGLSELLINEIGSYAGQVAVAQADAGRYRVSIEADGSWAVILTRPIPGPSAKAVPATFKGQGSRVLRIRTTSDLQPIVTAKHRGESNFIVQLIGYGTVTGSNLLFNEIGNFNGQTLVDDMPAGSYLLAVQAEGAWTLRFTR